MVNQIHNGIYLQLDFFFYSQNLTNQVLGIITSKVRQETRKNKDMETADFLPLIEGLLQLNSFQRLPFFAYINFYFLDFLDYVRILTTIVKILNNKGCNHVANCSSASADVKETDVRTGFIKVLCLLTGIYITENSESIVTTIHHCDILIC